MFTSNADGSWCDVGIRSGSPHLIVTDRADRWINQQIGENGRSATEIDSELGCDWPTVNDTRLDCGAALIDDDPTRFGVVEALGLDEVLFVRDAPYRRLSFSTSFVHVRNGQLPDVGPGRSGAVPTA
jgi:hypothetical protein